MPYATLARMSHTAEQLQSLVAACEQFRGAKAPDGYRDGLALCVIDSVQSTGVKYSSVENVVARYRAHRRAQGGDPNADGIPELLDTFDELDGPDGWAQKIGNSNRTSTRGGVLKAQAIRDAARVLEAQGIGTTAALRQSAEDEAQLEQVREAWCAVTGQRSGITWHYMQMLAGIEGVKPDRMICRFVADALGLPRRVVMPPFALEVLTAAAKELDMSPTNLDHAVWQFQRNRK
ncbi:putative uncharacterized protein [Mycolicibacterium fortuitum subsp. acetamidolyticum]|uniref:Heme peroxidase superfamily protein n=1 Tax=Mycolicibacterium fortuitum subsp. acetamidolyticum TaxID=144550 RepID=A0A100WSV5_MYCFO|nr:putative uncharacterized protein [Mycolicibacterium fortuitum subsp. acetamidolyticum]